MREPWPALRYEAWHETCATLHLWLQIVGKLALAQLPWTPHSWHVALAVTARGLATRLMPHGTRAFQVELDFIAHLARIRVSDGGEAVVPLEPQSVAVFYRRVMDALRSLGVPVAIRTMPNELPDPLPFDRDETHRAYDADYARRHWELLVQAQRVLERFRARFVGKCSPVQYFWGGPDLALTRFSGRRAPEHPGGVPNLPDWVVRDAYSHEVSSAGFWAGNDQHPHATFYSYFYPEPQGFAQAEVRPREARYSAELREFVLPYDALRRSASPDDMLLEFLQSTYEIGARLASWPSDLTPAPA